MTSENKNKKEKTFSIADILMVCGFVALLFSTYMGSMLLTGNFTEAVITTVAVMGISILFLWLIITAKKAHNHRQAWLITEFTLVVAFVFLFIGILTNRSRHYIYMTSQKETLHNDALHDKGVIMSLFDKFERTEKNSIDEINLSFKAIPSYTKLYSNDDKTKDRISTWKGSGKVKPLVLGEGYSQAQINAWADYYQKKVLNPNILEDASKLKDEYMEQIDSIISSIESGSDYGKYYSMSKQLQLIYSDAADQLTELSKNETKYRINANGGELTSQSVSTSYHADDSELRLSSHFNGVPQYTKGGWWFSIALLLLISISYLAARRSRRVTVLSSGFLGLFRKRKSVTNDGGINIC